MVWKQKEFDRVLGYFLKEMLSHDDHDSHECNIPWNQVLISIIMNLMNVYSVTYYMKLYIQSTGKIN